MEEQPDSLPERHERPARRTALRKLIPYLVIAVLSLAVGLGFHRGSGFDNASPCVINFVCDDHLDKMRGDYRKVQYGLPATYRATEKFTRRPDSSTTYGTTLREFQPFSPLLAALNVVFWFALLDAVWRLLRRLLHRRQPAE